MTGTDHPPSHIFGEHASPHVVLLCASSLLFFHIQIAQEDVTISFPGCRTTYHHHPHDDLRRNLVFFVDQLLYLYPRTNTYKHKNRRIKDDLHLALAPDAVFHKKHRLGHRHVISMLYKLASCLVLLSNRPLQNKSQKRGPCMA